MDDLDKILGAALHLPRAARAALAARLLESVEDAPRDIDAEIAWEQEVQRRLAEVDSGAVRLVPWAETEHKLKSIIDGSSNG
jgi:putative addiction module component (TIGR02574 family)